MTELYSTFEMLSIPGLVLIVGAVILAFAPKNVRPGLFLLFPLVSLMYVSTRPDGFTIAGSLLGLDLILFQMDALSRVFGIIFSLTALVAGIYAYHMKELGQQTQALTYAGGALGVTFAGDLLTLIIFWELMAISSTWLIWASRNKESDSAGMRYLIYHILGGGLFLTGILLHYHDTSSLLTEALSVDFTAANLLMLAGVSINAAVIPMHTWLADSYPKATITGAVFMSAFTTKSAVYVLIRMFPGWDPLIWLGAAMAIYGVVYAVICKDIREILAYHIISQVGFMVCGIGIGTDMSLNGATAHAYSHILYKSLLFMSTGAVLYATGTSKMIQLGGLFKKMPAVFILYMIGALSISGLPLFNGYISKSMTISAAGYAHEEGAMLLLLFASVGTFLSVGLKLPYYTWFSKSEPESDLSFRPIPKNMFVAMSIAAAACVFYGLYPQALYTYLPFPSKYDPFTIYHFVEVMQISLMTFTGFWIFRKKLAPELILALDVDWFFRKLAPASRILFIQTTDRLFELAESMINKTASALTKAFQNPLAWMPNWFFTGGGSDAIQNKKIPPADIKDLEAKDVEAKDIEAIDQDIKKEVKADASQYRPAIGSVIGLSITFIILLVLVFILK